MEKQPTASEIMVLKFSDFVHFGKINPTDVEFNQTIKYGWNLRRKFVNEAIFSILDCGTPMVDFSSRSSLLKTRPASTKKNIHKHSWPI